MIFPGSLTALRYELQGRDLRVCLSLPREIAIWELFSSQRWPPCCHGQSGQAPRYFPPISRVPLDYDSRWFIANHREPRRGHRVSSLLCFVPRYSWDLEDSRFWNFARILELEIRMRGGGKDWVGLGWVGYAAFDDFYVWLI